MSIQFQCSQCQKMMQAPDGTEGKKARCPSCSAISQIPGITAAPPVTRRAATPPPAPVPTPRSFGAPTTGENPFQAPSTTNYSAAQASSRPAGRYLPVWQERPSFKNFFKSTRQILLEPGETFRNLKRSEGFDVSLGYAAIGGGLLGMLFGFLGFLVFMLVLLPQANGNGGIALMGGIIGIIIATFMYSAFYAVGAVIGCFVGGGMIHLLMMLVGGKKYGYATTVRTIAYTQWSVWPFMVVPVLGWLLAVVWLPVIQIIALAEVHETSKSKAALAVLLPFVLLFGLAMVGAILEQM